MSLIHFILIITTLKHLGKIMRIRLDTSFAYETQFLDKLQNCVYRIFSEDILTELGMNSGKKNAILFFILISFILGLSAKTKKSDEARFQLGFGAMVSTSNLLSLIETSKLYKSMEEGGDYSFPGLSKEQSMVLGDMQKNIGRALLVANILGGLEFGVNCRVLWNAFMFDSNVILLPFDGSYNGRLDFLVNANIGVRAPFWIMPYINAGVNFTFSWYPENVSNIDSWKSWGVFNNFVFRPGMNVRTGLDIKFRHFSIGAYYQYTIKDFDEFGA